MTQTDMLERRRFRTIVMDPPWAERGGGKIKRGADRHYDLAGKLGDIGPIVRAIRGSGLFEPEDNAHLFCWYTDNFLEDALALVRELGFTYKRTFQWVKVGDDDRDVAASGLLSLIAYLNACRSSQNAFRPTNEEWKTIERMYSAALPLAEYVSPDGIAGVLDDDLSMGIGQYGRGCHEGMIFATHGRGQDASVWQGNRDVRSVFHAPHERDANGKKIHSRKPRKSYELIERVSRGPYLEMFARTRFSDAWTVWGDEAP